MRARRAPLIAAVIAAIGALACACRSSSSATSSPPSSEPSAPLPPRAASLVVARPYAIHEPPKHDARAPLVVLLHGFGGTGADMAESLGFTALADAHGFYLATPNGTPNAHGERFWSATDACCNFFGDAVDDVAYLDAVLDDSIARHPIDASRVYVVGFSNGAFMAHRYACDRAERVAAIASLAGATWSDATKCHPRAPVAVLEIHGDADDIVLYRGSDGMSTPKIAALGRPGARKGPYPGAHATVERWAKLDGCVAEPVHASLGPSVDDDRWGRCAGGADVELRTMLGVTHWLPLGQDGLESLWSFLAAHTRR